MLHLHVVGQTVGYAPIGCAIDNYKITKRMPEEEQAIDPRYRIKSEYETFERCVPESQLVQARK